MSEQSIHGVTCTCCGEVVSSRFIEDGECVGCRNGGDVADPRLVTDGGVDAAPATEMSDPEPTAAPPHYDPARVFVEGTAEEVVDVVHHVRGSDWVTLWCELEDGRAVDKRYVPNERVIFIEPGADDE